MLVLGYTLNLVCRTAMEDKLYSGVRESVGTRPMPSSMPVDEICRKLSDTVQISVQQPDFVLSVGDVTTASHNYEYMVQLPILWTETGMASAAVHSAHDRKVCRRRWLSNPGSIRMPSKPGQIRIGITAKCIRYNHQVFKTT